MAEIDTSCFKAYDIRGKVPAQLNEDMAYRIGKACATLLKPKRFVVGRDNRYSSSALVEALSLGLRESGCHVYDIGLCGTEQVYFATFHLGVDGGIMVTASHNPPEYNGMKLVRSQAKPISGDSGLREIENLVKTGSFAPSCSKGKVEAVDIVPAYIDHLLGLIDVTKLKPLHLACNPGNGCAGVVLEVMQDKLPFQFDIIHGEPDGSFPNGVPNPLLPENRESTAQLVRQAGAHLGVAWDGDFDRCFFFDEQGNFIDGYYIVGFLARFILDKNPGGKIIHDPRLVWNTVEIVEERGGIPIQSKTGHAFIKERMRSENAVYGGEMSAHYYFREFAYCDSGMIPWLLITSILAEEGKPFSSLVAKRMERYPISGEINRQVEDPDKTLARVEEHYRNDALNTDYTDGLSMTFSRWRFNLRKSNTEPLVRLNVETRRDKDLLQAKTEELLHLIS